MLSNCLEASETQQYFSFQKLYNKKNYQILYLVLLLDISSSQKFMKWKTDNLEVIEIKKKFFSERHGWEK
jgi:hypothetical protein